MVNPTDKKQKGVLRSLDWWTIIIYLALISFGWVSVCGASYSYGDTDIFSLDTRSGMQIIWIGTSIILGFVILMLDDRFYDMFALIIFGVMLCCSLPRSSIRIVSRAHGHGSYWDHCACSRLSLPSLPRLWRLQR